LTPEPANITQLLVAWSEGDAAALPALAPLVERELHRIAASYMANERREHTLQPTALVNEAFVRLVGWNKVRWQNRAHFYGVAAQVMRRVLVDFARSRQRGKRGGAALHVTLNEALDHAAPSRDADLVELDDALRLLERLSSRQCQVVELRFFGGLELEEIAHVLGVSIGTVRRDWSLARAWLFCELDRTNRSAATGR